MSEKEKMNNEELEKVVGGTISDKDRESLKAFFEEYDKHHSSTHKCVYCGAEYKIYDAEIFNDACPKCRKIPLGERVRKS